MVCCIYAPREPWQICRRVHVELLLVLSETCQKTTLMQQFSRTAKADSFVPSRRQYMRVVPRGLLCFCTDSACKLSMTGSRCTSGCIIAFSTFHSCPPSAVDQSSALPVRGSNASTGTNNDANLCILAHTKISTHLLQHSGYYTELPGRHPDYRDWRVHVSVNVCHCY